MPSKIQLDENLWFLYICLQKSDLKSIDFSAVGLATNLKPPAARMRYTRLRRQIESGTLIGTHGTPFQSSPSSTANSSSQDPAGKRKRISAEDESEYEIGGMKAEKKEVKVKSEGIKEEGNDEWDSGSGSEGWDSEDEMPLAKLRKEKLVNSIHPALQSLHMPGLEVPGNGGAYGGGYHSEDAAHRTAGQRFGRSGERSVWEGMIPVGNVGIDFGFVGYGGGGNGFQGDVGGWDQASQFTMSSKPRKSV